MTTAQFDTMYWFTTKTCQPCKRMAPSMQKLIDAGVPVTKIDAHDFPEIAARYEVTSVPTLMIINEDGGVRKRHQGALNEFGLWKFIE